MTAVGDDNGLDGDVAVTAGVVLNQIEDLSSLGHLTENDMPAVEVRSGTEAEEELAAIGVRASVGHREDAAASVLVLEVLVGELLTVDGLATSAVATSEVATLCHEACNDTVEGAALEMQRLSRPALSLLSSAESAEVLRGLRGVLGKLHDDTACSLAADSDVEVDLSHRVLVTIFLWIRL